MQAGTKFTFATDFAKREDPDRKPTYDKVTLLAREEAAYAKGKAEGLEEGFSKGQSTMRDQMLSSFEKEMADTLQTLVSSSDMCLQDLEKEVSRHHDAMLHLALTVAKKIADEALTRFGIENVERMVRETLKELSSLPHIVLRVSSKTAEELETRIKTLRAETGFQGKVIILPEEGLDDADCRIEWADGALLQSRKATEDKVIAMIESALAPETLAPETLAPETLAEAAPTPDALQENDFDTPPNPRK